VELGFETAEQLAVTAREHSEPDHLEQAEGDARHGAEPKADEDEHPFPHGLELPEQVVETNLDGVGVGEHPAADQHRHENRQPKQPAHDAHEPPHPVRLCTATPRGP